MSHFASVKGATGRLVSMCYMKCVLLTTVMHPSLDKWISICILALNNMRDSKSTTNQ